MNDKGINPHKFTRRYHVGTRSGSFSWSPSYDVTRPVKGIGSHSCDKCKSIASCVKYTDPDGEVTYIAPYTDAQISNLSRRFRSKIRVIETPEQKIKRRGRETLKTLDLGF